ncbi:MAG: IclR family transcriptional regulator [Stappiaceae bacterium]
MARLDKAKTKARGLDRAFGILDFLCSTGKPLRPIEISEGMQAPKSTIYELVGLLLNTGVLERVDNEGRVFLGRKLNYWSVNYNKHFNLNKLARPLLEMITEKTRETAQLCMLDGNKYYVAMMKEGNRTFRISADVGERTPIPWTASGRLLLGHLSEEEIISLIPEEDFTLPDGSRLDPIEFSKSVRKASTDKFFSFNSLADNYTHCFAAPVFDANGRCSSTLCIIAPRDDASLNYNDYKAVLTEAGQLLTEQIRDVPTVLTNVAAE